MTEYCSEASRSRDEPLAATASRVARWLLVEHRGAWGPQAVPTSRMPATAARALARTADAAEARLLMVRRPARMPAQEGRQVFAVDSRPGREQVLTRHVASDAELAGLTWPPDDAWTAHEEPLYLVCTHGRHDRCCAVRGRPVAQALAVRYPERTWEVSHVGGDRFAANLVVLPEGLYLGRIEAPDVVGVVEGLAAGRLPPGHVRGRSSLSLPVQAAQQLARDALDCWGAAQLAPVEQVGVGTDAWRVRLADPDVDVVVRYDRSGDGVRHLLTCGAQDAQLAPVFRQVSLTRR